ncbi:MAG: hypothetical protein IJ131_11560 [Eggerthellaceae bacterium]|nr:hypothetical protein [Eggerthellaceae bacterium]
MENDSLHDEQNEQSCGRLDPQATYRKLGQPADTVSGTTKELFEVRGPGGGADGASTAFKVIAAVAIVAVVLAIVATQFGLF